jgi:hypothetical protein
VDAEEVKSAAGRVGLDRLQQYLDHLTRTRAYDWFEARPLTEGERRRLTWLVGKDDLGYDEQSTALTRRGVVPLRGDKLDEYLSTADLVALVNAMPFVRWYREERQRLQRDAQLLTNVAEQRESIAEAALTHAQADDVALNESYPSGAPYPPVAPYFGWPPYYGAASYYGAEWEAYWSQSQRIVDLRTAAAAERRAAAWASSKAADIRSAADRLSGVTSRDLASLGTAFELFICREFSHDLSPVDSVAILFLKWVDEESICCASPKCSRPFLLTSARRRRPQEYCLPACRMAACRAREESIQFA